MNGLRQFAPGRRGVGLLALLLVLVLPVSINAAQGRNRDTAVHSPELRAFDLISATNGWALSGPQLYWTTTAGRTWTDITPPGHDQFTIQATFFLDARHGWAILARSAAPDTVAYLLARTSDTGRTWLTQSLALFEPQASETFPAAVHLHFLDPENGWLVIRHPSSSNFRVGSLFRTTDGGDNWTQLSIPIGEPVYFITSELGWTAGGVAGAEFYHTVDGGRTWQAQTIGTASDYTRGSRLAHLPRFTDARSGTAPIVEETPGAQRLDLYATSDGGRSWELAVSTPLAPSLTPGKMVALSAVGAHTWTIASSGSADLLHISGTGQIEVVEGRDPIAAGIVTLDMVTPDIGWATSLAETCWKGVARGDIKPQADQGDICQQSVALLRTDNAGRNWAILPLPEQQMPEMPASQPAPDLTSPARSNSASLSQTEPWLGQGFDKCEIPTSEQLQTWKTHSPYGAVNLYIGGSCRGCANQGLMANYVTQASQQGWKFIPTWVGPQSACWPAPYCDRISNDPSAAYSQGLAEADAAVAAAINLGLASPDGSGTIVYYDLEGYGGGDPACRAAAQAFISGWTARLHGYGSQSGIYGSACGSAISDFAAIGNVPDAIWPAHWIHSSYEPNATVWGVACLSNGLWANHQRIRQYAGGHYESWGGVTLNIDANAIDGIVGVGRIYPCCRCCSALTTDKTSIVSTTAACAESSPSATSADLLFQPRPPASQPSTAAAPPGDLLAPVTPVVAKAPVASTSGYEALAAPARRIEKSPSGIVRGSAEPLRVPPISANYTIPKSVFGAGGGLKISAHYQMNSTQGQSTDLNQRQSSGYRLIPGYWKPDIPVVYTYGIYLPLALRQH